LSGAVCRLLRHLVFPHEITHNAASYGFTRSVIMPARDVYIVETARTPFLKSRGMPGPFSASDLAVAAGREALLAQQCDPSVLDEVILGCMIPSEDEANIARLVGLRLGCDEAMPAWTVQRNCASALQALDSAFKDISLGRADAVLAGGTESMSRAPLLWNAKMVKWLAALSKAKTTSAKAAGMARLRPDFFKPIISLMHGLTDPLVALSMPQTAEELAYRFGIDREAMDAYALQSQQRAAAAQAAGYFEDSVALFDASGCLYDQDEGVRTDTDMAKLGRLRPVVNRRFGVVTAGNSSQLTDGASVLLLASEEAVKKHGFTPKAKIIDCAWAGLDPAVMGLGPVFASSQLMTRNRLALSDIDAWEINEAFAAQTLACLQAFASDDFARQHLGRDQAWGVLDEAKVNVDGGAIALGHPVGASGARITAQLLHVLNRMQGRYGIATLCIGGGQGGAMLIERIN
jgi:acetyl-CoA C-acetyltransferase